jgi:PilZ domain
MSGSALRAVSELRHTDARREPRTAVVRLVEYTAFPRAARDAAWRCGFTRDISDNGFGLVTTRPEPEGTLLRVVVLDVDGRPTQDAVARVVWSCELGEGRHRLGLERLALGARGMLRVRRDQHGRARTS